MKNKYYIVISKLELENIDRVFYCDWYEVKEEAELRLQELKEKFPRYSSFIYSADKLNSEKEI